MPAARAACPRGCVRLGLSRCWTCVQGMESAGLPIVAARAAAMGVCVFESVAGALRAGDEWFSVASPRRGRGGGGRRGGKSAARDESLAPTTNSRGATGPSIANDFAATRVSVIT